MSMHSKYDDFYKNEMFYTLSYITHHVITSINYMLSLAQLFGPTLEILKNILNI